MRRKKAMENPVSMYLFTCGGHVQNCEHDGKKGMLVARGVQAARRLAKTYNLSTSRRISPTRVGSLQNETLECHIAASMRLGCQGAWITYDGEHLDWYSYEGMPDCDT